MNTPEVVGVPLIVIVFELQSAVTPAGRPVAMPMPVAPVVVWVIADIAVLIQTVGEDEAGLAVFEEITATVALAVFVQPFAPVTVTV